MYVVNFLYNYYLHMYVSSQLAMPLIIDFKLTENEFSVDALISKKITLI
jgi:hypothetical protein